MSRSPESTRNASGRRGFPWRAAGLFLTVLMALAGTGLLGYAVLAPEPPRPPQPAPAAAPSFLADPTSLGPPAPTTGPDGTQAGTAAAQSESEGAEAGSDETGEGAAEPESPAMHRSVPTRLRIPSITVDAEVIEVGLDKDQRIEVPPLERAHLTGWYKHGPTPGEIGNAVIVGHVDSYRTGPAVFFHLGALQPGERIEVVRADGTVATFVVDGVAKYPKAEFPTDLVYGPTDRAQLRLVTCGGNFDSRTREYLDNVIVFATLADPST